MSENRFDSHLEIWWLNKANPQAAKERPVANELHPNQDLEETKKGLSVSEIQQGFTGGCSPHFLATNTTRYHSNFQYKYQSKKEFL